MKHYTVICPKCGEKTLNEESASGITRAGNFEVIYTASCPCGFSHDRNIKEEIPDVTTSLPPGVRLSKMIKEEAEGFPMLNFLRIKDGFAIAMNRLSLAVVKTTGIKTAGFVTKMALEEAEESSGKSHIPLSAEQVPDIKFHEQCLKRCIPVISEDDSVSITINPSYLLDVVESLKTTEEADTAVILTFSKNNNIGQPVILTIPGMSDRFGILMSRSYCSPNLKENSAFTFANSQGE